MPALKKRPKNYAERLRVLEEFGFAVATPHACAIADALITERARVDYFESKLRTGNEVFLSREMAEDDELAYMIYVGEKDNGTPWVAGERTFRRAVDSARRVKP